MQKEMPRQTAREKKSRSKMWKTVLPYKKWARPVKVRKKGSICEKKRTFEIVSQLW
jgi:hypothetical protein